MPRIAQWLRIAGRPLSRSEARREGKEIGEKRGLHEGNPQTARNLLKSGLLDNEQIAQVTGPALAEVIALRQEGPN